MLFSEKYPIRHAFGKQDARRRAAEGTTAHLRERVLATSDERLLQRWFDRVLTASSIEEVFSLLDA